MLISDLEIFRTHYPAVNVSLEFDGLIPHIRRVENEYIIPIIGQALYDEVAAYSAPTGKELELQTRIRDAIAPLAFYFWIPSGMADVSNQGVQISRSDDKYSAFEWQLTKIEENAMSMGLAAIDQVLEYLMANADNFDAWKSSTQYKDYNKLFLRNSLEFTEFSDLRISRWLFQQMVPVIKRVQRNIILPLLGQAFYDEILGEIKNENVTDPNQLILDRIGVALANYALSKALPMLSVNLTDKGLIVFVSNRGGDQHNPVEPERLNNLAIKAGETARVEYQGLHYFLNQNADDYDNYTASADYKTAFENDEDQKYFFAG